MNEQNYEEINETMEDISANIPVINKGDIVLGKVISVNDDEVMVNIGYMADGIISKDELSYDKNVVPTDILKEDDEIYVSILQVSDDEGNVVLSKRRADSIKVWDELDEMFKEKTHFEVVVKEAVKGGLTTEIKGIRAFIPASHISVAYVENLQKYVGEKLTVEIIELNKENRKVVASSKVIEKEELEVKKAKLWSDIKKGQKRSGTVSRLAKFGAFVDLGGVDGLIHLSELSWKRVNNPAEVVSVGDSVEVYVLDADKEKNRISLALKDVNADPWKNALDKYKMGNVVEGKVVRFATFGAFVELEPGIDGLVHISEISEERIEKASAVLNLGDNVQVKILEIDGEKHKISLSIKEAIDKPVIDYSEFAEEEENLTMGDLFGDKLKNFKFD